MLKTAQAYLKRDQHFQPHFDPRRLWRRPEFEGASSPTPVRSSSLSSQIVYHSREVTSAPELGDCQSSRLEFLRSQVSTAGVDLEHYRLFSDSVLHLTLYLAEIEDLLESREAVSTPQKTPPTRTIGDLCLGDTPINTKALTPIEILFVPQFPYNFLRKLLY